MVINTNINSMNASRSMNINSAKAGKSMEKLSSGSRINRAGDDAAGLSISEKMRGQIRGLNQAFNNTQDGISLVQTAESALNETESILQRMRELSVQAANGTMVTSDKAAIDAEGAELVKEIDNIAANTKFNQISLLDGSTKVTVQIGANAGDSLALDLDTKTKSDATTLAVAPPFQVSVGTASTTVIDNAIKSVSSSRAYLGANQNRLEHIFTNIGTASENLTSAESRIRDVDMAKEMSEFSKNNILVQASQAMLSQANQMPQQVLQLLK